MEDPISTVICYDCWEKVMEFHQFYLKVQQAHCRYSQIHVNDTIVEKRKFCSVEKVPEPQKRLEYAWHKNMLSYVDGGESKTEGDLNRFENIEIEVCAPQVQAINENKTKVDNLSFLKQTPVRVEDTQDSDENFNENCSRLLCPHPNCDRWLKDKNNLRTHIKQQHPNDNRYNSYICYICDRFCKNRNSYTNHIRYAHSSNTFTCEECHKTFKKAITLRVCYSDLSQVKLPLDI